MFFMIFHHFSRFFKIFQDFSRFFKIFKIFSRFLRIFRKFFQNFRFFLKLVKRGRKEVCAAVLDRPTPQPKTTPKKSIFGPQKPDSGRVGKIDKGRARAYSLSAVGPLFFSNYERQEKMVDRDPHPRLPIEIEWGVENCRFGMKILEIRFFDENLSKIDQNLSF